jgi:hypothetical protein
VITVLHLQVIDILILQPDTNIKKADAIASFNSPASNNGRVDIEIPSSALQYIVGGSNARTMFRIRATTTGSFTANTLFLYGGDTETTQYAPVLKVLLN